MTTRILFVTTERALAGCPDAAAEIARMARESGAAVRFMYCHPLPRPRTDRHDRVVADTDAEMTRLGAAAEARLARLARTMGDVSIECVVRFGRLAHEVGVEAAAYGADLVALPRARRPGLLERAHAWYLSRVALGGRVTVKLLPARFPGRDGRSGEAVAVPAR